MQFLEHLSTVDLALKILGWARVDHETEIKPSVKALTRHTISFKMKWINLGWIRPVLLYLFRNHWRKPTCDLAVRSTPRYGDRARIKGKNRVFWSNVTISTDWLQTTNQWEGRRSSNNVCNEAYRPCHPMTRLVPLQYGGCPVGCVIPNSVAVCWWHGAVLVN